MDRKTGILCGSLLNMVSKWILQGDRCDHERAGQYTDDKRDR